MADIVKSFLFFVDNPPPEELKATWWNQCLCWVSFFNLFVLIVFVLARKTPLAEIKFAPKQTGVGFWKLIAKLRWLLALNYVIACGIRSIWPRHDGDRHCFYDAPISSVAVGRSLATVAELSYCAQLCLALVCFTGKTGIANILLIANVVAQTCCWYSVITQNQMGHTVEESIWLVTGVVLTYCAATLNTSKTTYTKDALNLKFWMILAGTLYVLFMALVDVPMYYNRYMADTAAGKVYQSFAVGMEDITQCRAVTRLDTYWTVEMPWMSLYFSFAVWSSIWLARANVGRVTEDSKKAK